MSLHQAKRAVLIWALAVAMALLSSATAGQAQSPDVVRPHLLLSADQGSYDALVSALTEQGSRLLHQFPPYGVMAELSGAGASLLVDRGVASYATAESVPDSKAAALGTGAHSVIAAWNGLQSDHTAVPAADLHEPENDALVSLDAGGLGAQALDPSLYQQSEYMIGRVAINLVLIESDGSEDPSTEDWTIDRQDRVFQQVVKATSWWQDMEPRAQLEFVYQDYYSDPVEVSYEPINRPHYEDRLWISEAVGSLGQSHSSYMTATRLLNRATRDEYQADWVFTIFVVDSLNDSDNLFSDSYFAYAYINGPYMVLTYGCNGYGPENMAAVIAHEMGHIFGALDEYAAAQVPADTESGYLGVENGNSQLGGSINVGCIMRGGISPFVLKQVCRFTAGQVGWRDSDGDGLLDPIDTDVEVSLSVSQTAAGMSLLGTATDVPYPSTIRTPITTNAVVSGHYRVNGGVWRPLTCADGDCDASQESFGLLLPAAPAGEWDIEVAFGNDQGNVGSAQAHLALSGQAGPDAIDIEAHVTETGEGAATVAGSAMADADVGPLLAVERRLDDGEWVEVVAAGETELGTEAQFEFKLADLASGTHVMRLRAAAVDPWVQSEAWQQSFSVAAADEPSGSATTSVMLLPLVSCGP